MTIMIECQGNFGVSLRGEQQKFRIQNDFTPF